MEGCKEGVSETGRDKDDGAAKNESNTRKQLLKTLRSSIETKGQADAKRRRCLEVELRPENSREGEDPKALNRVIKLRLLKMICNSLKSIRENCIQAPTGDQQLERRINICMDLTLLKGKPSPSLISSMQGKRR